jgi:hypothetical protein
MSRAKTDRAARFREILEQAAKDLGCEPTADVATHVAALRMGRETHLAKLIAGADVDPDALLRIDAALKRYLPEAPPHKIEIAFCESLTGICPNCKHEVYPYTPPRAPSPMPTPSSKPAGEENPTSDVPALVETPSNVVAIDKAKEAAAFKKANSMDNLIARHDEPWRPHVGGSNASLSARGDPSSTR